MSDFKIVKLLDPISLNINIIPRGAYDSGTTYVLGDSVSYSNSSYVAKQTTTGNLPTDTTYWQLLASSSTLKLSTTARNLTGSTIPAGAVVYFSGASGNLPTIALSQANSELASTKTIGIAAVSIANNASGEIVVIGLADSLDTSAFSDGDSLWLSPSVAGGVTTTKPSAPNHMVFIGFVTRSHPTQGTIEVKIQNGFELEELHNVAISSLIDAQVLRYEAATSLWKNHTPTKSDIGLGSVVNADTTTTANITDSTNKRFVTDAEKTVLGNTSGTNTGDQDLSGKENVGVAAGLITAHEAASDPHPQYLTATEGSAAYEPANPNIQSHISSTSNPHSVTATQVGLGNVDNTSDLDKPISTATQTALNLKQDSLGYTPANETLSNLPSTSIGADLLPETDGIYNIGASGQNWDGVNARTVGYDGGIAINLDSKKMFDSAAEESIDFEARILKDEASLSSVQYAARALLDTGGAEALSWQSRYLADDSELQALDWIDRRLWADDGSTVILDWSSATGPSTITQSPGDNSTKIATTAYVDDIAPTFLEFFGSEKDGNLTLTGSLTLTQDVFYNTLTLGPGAALNTSGYRIFCKTLDLSNAPARAIRREGSNGNSTTTQAGAGLIGALASQTLGGSANGGAGATGTTGVGAQAGASGSLVNSNGGASGAGGAGGNGTPNAGGASRAASTVGTNVEFNRIAFDFLRGAVLISGGAGAPGGSAGGGDGVNNGRGGGGGASGAGVVAIFAHTIITSVSTPAGVISCVGGNGGNGANGGAGNVGGGGGGGGSGGGFVYIMYANRVGPVISNLINCSGGNGGNAGNGFGTGLGGRGGGGGNGGRIITYNITSSSGTTTVGSSGTIGGANVGITGGTGGAGGNCSTSL